MMIGEFFRYFRMSIRYTSLFFVLIFPTYSYLKYRRSKKRNYDISEENAEIEKNFEKNENGLYPWEVDIDDSPKSIKSDSKRLNIPKRTYRGKW